MTAATDYTDYSCLAVPQLENTSPLSSRKDGGLGAKYAKQYIDFYRKNPQCLDISVCDPYSGMVTTISLPDYFRRLYFPAKSIVVSMLVS